MVAVFIWLPKRRKKPDGSSETDIGHGALMFRGGYVSNWPGALRSVAWGPGFAAPDLADDVSSEGGLPQLIYVLKALDEEAMGSKWTNMKKDLKYSFPIYNCFTTVAEVIASGLSFAQSLLGDTVIPHSAVIAHAILITYVQQVLLATEGRVDMYGETPQEAMKAFLKELNSAQTAAGY
jgi:hypothetical protein